MEKGAHISLCSKYRFKLWRIWDRSKPLVLFIMHNPSKADGVQDDATIRRCINFAKSWGYGGLYVGNLSPYRATKPKDVEGVGEFIHAENFKLCREMEAECEAIVFAHGLPVKTIATRYKGCTVNLDLGAFKFQKPQGFIQLTADGYAGHPLFLPSHLLPQFWAYSYKCPAEYL